MDTLVKYIVATTALLFCVVAQSQRFYQAGYAPISPKELALSLTANATTDEQKVYALFHWITDNIDYRLKPVGLKSVPPDTSTMLKPLDEIVAESVLRNKVAVCDGYARLFKTLCHYAGISCEMISGYARVGTPQMRTRFGTNHSWNAVLIDSVWQLVDVTWASGYVSYRGEYFVRHYDSKYYLTKPEYFIQDHYPEDPQWALLPSLPTLNEFKYAPFKTGAFVRSKVERFLPSAGIIQASVGDTIRFYIGAQEKMRPLFLSDGSGYVQPFMQARSDDDIRGESNWLLYIASHKKDTWLDVLHEDEVLLRYKLIVKEKSQ